jgi:F-type H+-transporting ATPase subunit b
MDKVVDFLFSHQANFFWSLGAFLVFVVILYPLGVKKILAAIDAREAKIRGDLGEAEQAALKAKQVRADLDQQMKDAEHRIQELMSEARRDAEGLKSTMMDQGRTEIEALRVRALREIEAARHGAIVSLRREVAEIAVIVASQAIDAHMDVNKHEALVVDAIDRFEAQQAAAGKG